MVRWLIWEQSQDDCVTKHYVPQRIFLLKGCVFETTRWLLLIQFFTFSLPFLHLNITSCDYFPGLAH